MTRTAIIRTKAHWRVPTLTEVQRYLPSNYHAVADGDDIIITGEDSAGWGLTTYVIPRLASGLIYAREVREEW
jgi:hypothetical protein